jgi:hypothetical protein
LRERAGGEGCERVLRFGASSKAALTPTLSREEREREKLSAIALPLR